MSNWLMKVGAWGKTYGASGFPNWGGCPAISFQMPDVDEQKRNVRRSKIPAANQVVEIACIAGKEPRRVPSAWHASGAQGGIARQRRCSDARTDRLGASMRDG